MTPNQSKIVSDPIHETCSRGGHIFLPELKLKEPDTKIVKSRREAVSDQACCLLNIVVNARKLFQGQNEPQSILTITKDGLYIFILRIESDDGYLANVHVEMKGPHGYLSAVDWPLLPV